MFKVATEMLEECVIYVRSKEYKDTTKTTSRTSRSITKRYGIFSKLTIKTPELRYWHRSGVFNGNFEHISYLFFSVSIVDFEQVNNFMWNGSQSVKLRCPMPNIHGKTPLWNSWEHLILRKSAYGCFWTDFLKWLFGNLFLDRI